MMAMKMKVQVRVICHDSSSWDAETPVVPNLETFMATPGGAIHAALNATAELLGKRVEDLEPELVF